LTRPRMIVIGPLPPPTHGVTVSTSLVLANGLLHDRFRLEHLDTSDHRSGENIGRWDRVNLVLGLRQLLRLIRKTRGEKGVVYLPISQGAAGFLRDSVFVRTSARAGWKVAVHLRGGEFQAFYRNQPPLFRQWTRGTLKRVTSAAVMGESLMHQFEGLIEPHRIVVVPNGTPDPEPGNQKRQDTVLFLSNLRRRKGIREAFAAAEEVLRAEPSARFLFVGDWEDAQLEREIMQRAERHRPSIEFRHSITGDEKQDLLGSAGILLFTPVGPEGHPRVVLEAIAAGLPVVATDRGAIAETVADGESGFVLPDPSPSELAERVLRLLRDEGLRTRMSAAARTRYLTMFTQDRADQLLANWLSSVATSGEGDESERETFEPEAASG
jgi:glycosyltransferase involved in cell wall biosynthesis